MTSTTISSREFNQDTGGAKKAVRLGSVFITDCGQSTHVLLSIKGYRKFAGGQPSIAKQLIMHAGGDVVFEPSRLRDGLLRHANA